MGFYTFAVFAEIQWLNSSGMGWNSVPQPESGVPPPRVVATPPGQLIFGKIITIVATRGQILMLKCT